MARPDDVRYLKSHEWCRNEGDSFAVGISDFAVDALNKEIVYVELPDVGRKVTKGQSFGVIESVKAASDLYAPISGEVVAANAEVVNNPALVADEPYGNGWMIKIKPSDETEYDALLTPEQYDQQAAEEAH